jgi:HK97 family phage major capsid protein
MAVNDIITRSDTGEGSGTLIPEAERKEILKGLPAASAVLQLARKVNMSTKVERQPVLSALPAAYWVTGDTGLKQTTKAEWENKTLTAEEIAVIIPVPEALIADAGYDIFGELRPLIIEAIGIKLDEATLFGTDAPAGFTEAIVPDAISAGNTVDLGSGVDVAADISEVMSAVEEDGFMVNGFAARTRMKGRLRGLRDANEGLLFQPSLQAGTPGTLYGENIAYSDANGAWNAEFVDLIAGDWSKAVVGVRQDITFKLFTEGVISDGSGNVVLNLMQQDSVALRVVARYGFAVANPINRLHEVEASRYPFAVLETTEGS